MGRLTKGSFEGRLVASNTRTGAAISAFEKAAQELDAAADAQRVLADEVDAEIDRLVALRMKADQAIDDNTRVAQKIKDLIS